MTLWTALTVLLLASTPPVIEGPAELARPAPPATVIEVEEVEIEQVDEVAWMAVRAGTVFTPFLQSSPIAPDRRITSDRARACLDPQGRRGCGPVRGFDLHIEMFQTPGRSLPPRWSVFFRTGYTAGRFAFDPRDAEAGYTAGAPEALAYHTVPLFLGGNAYLFEKFPIRPYGGLGFGFDLLRLQYQRHGADPRTDISARIGFELHAGLEARFSNYVALNVEIRQLWSARRKIEHLPNYSNEGVSLIAGISFAIPVETPRRRKVTRTIRRVEPGPPVAPVAPVAPAPAAPLPPPVIVVPAPAPAPAPVTTPPATTVHVEVIQKQEIQPSAPNHLEQTLQTSQQGSQGHEEPMRVLPPEVLTTAPLPR